MTLDEAREHVGDGVVYKPAYGADQAEDGTIVRVSSRYVFVLYVGDRTAKATHPSMLQLLAGASA
ncbi:hypothetical protein ACPPVT_07625 [Angustibacter sp. McL0619]|uniref:hypothetical protein n=1 Tax=Angustibacter sp. McL0619 TaxID=3415676 RepID=UPI003CF29630